MATTAGNRASWLVIAGLAWVVIARPTACVVDENPGGDNADLTALLAAVGPAVVLPALEAAQVEASALQVAIDAWQAASPDDEAAARDAARDAWWSAMAAWQRVEPMQIGPLATSLKAVGGADHRDLIYSWPTINPCRVDQETVNAGWRNADYFNAALVNVRGLDALEHLLWAPPANACPSQVDINASGAWASLGENGVHEQRTAHAAAITAQLVADVDAAYDAWAPGGGDFSAKLVAGAGSPYDSQQQALNAVYNGLFYLETRTKDRKLALPLGMRDCNGDGCADQVESLPSGGGAAWLARNLEGFDTLFHGGGEASVADLLTSLGHGDLVARIDANLTTALDAVSALDGPLDQLVRSDREAVQAAHDAVKLLTDDIKGDLATLLSLQIPSEASGDND